MSVTLWGLPKSPWNGPPLSASFSLCSNSLSASITCLIQWWASKLFFYKRLKNKIDYFHHKSQDKFLILAFHACFACDKSMGLYLWSVPGSDPGSVSSGLWDAGNWLNFLKLRFLSLAMIRTALQPCLTQNVTHVLSRRHGSNSCLMMLFFPISRESLSSKKASPPCTSSQLKAVWENGVSTHPTRAGLCSLPANGSGLGTGVMGSRQECLPWGCVEAQVLSSMPAAPGSGSVGTHSPKWPALS